jgi:NAD(P)-dependent dehydrogenase (short-subunit alcohol dehydrogenase family)
MKLKNKIAVIKGGNSGIDLATGQEFMAQGARLIIIGRNAEAVAKAAKEIGGDTLGVTAVVSRVADLDRAFQTIREKAGRAVCERGHREVSAAGGFQRGIVR